MRCGVASAWSLNCLMPSTPGSITVSCRLGLTMGMVAQLRMPRTRGMLVPMPEPMVSWSPVANTPPPAAMNWAILVCSAAVSGVELKPKSQIWS